MGTPGIGLIPHRAGIAGANLSTHKDNCYDAELARELFGVTSPAALGDIAREAARTALAAEQDSLLAQESRFRVWLAAFIAHCAPDPRAMLSDVRYLARAEALIAVRNSRQWDI